MPWALVKLAGPRLMIRRAWRELSLRSSLLAAFLLFTQMSTFYYFLSVRSLTHLSFFAGSSFVLRSS